METRRGGRNLVTPHGVGDYPGINVVRPDPRWTVSVICPEPGQTIVGRGGERLYPYETVDGAPAQGFELNPGDRATLVRCDLPYFLCQWRLDRAEGL